MRKQIPARKSTLRLEKAVLSNAVFAVQVFLLFLLLFESKLAIPAVLQTVGRAHILFLHLPIGLLFFLAVLPLLQRELSTQNYRVVTSFLLHLCAITAVFAALMGLLLSQEAAYNLATLHWHKWTGVSVSLLTYGLLLLHEHFPKQKILFQVGVYVNIVLLLLAGHLGGKITHGENYVLAPLRDKTSVAFIAETPIYQAVIQPILEAKCYQCHNERKAKGGLIMTTLQELQKGGKHGLLWVAGQPDSSLLLQRALLPIADEYHMPPEGKSQLTSQEIALLRYWILDGAAIDKSINAYQKSDSLRILTQQALATIKTITKPDRYNFKAADENLIASLNTPFRSVSLLSQDAAALQAAIFVRASYQNEYLEELKAIKTQLTALNLSNLPIKDTDIKTIAQFTNLEKLILNNTDITGATLKALKNCTKLEQLALSGTAVTVTQLQDLLDFSTLKQVFVWNTALSETDLEQLNSQHIQFEKGYRINTEEVLQLSPPLLDQKMPVLKAGTQVNLESKFPDVVLHYTTDGSEPDSIQAAIYNAPIPINTFTELKAKAYRTNWKSSELASFKLFVEGLRPDTLLFLHTPNTQYEGQGAVTIVDYEKGNPANFRNNRWLGLREMPFDVLADFGANAPAISEIVVSFAENHGSHIMPPKVVHIWGGNDKEKLEKIARFHPKQPTDYGAAEISVACLSFPTGSRRYYRIVAEQLARLPSWHYAHKDKVRSWVFVDEVFFYAENLAEKSR